MTKCKPTVKAVAAYIAPPLGRGAAGAAIGALCGAAWGAGCGLFAGPAGPAAGLAIGAKAGATCGATAGLLLGCSETLEVELAQNSDAPADQEMIDYKRLSR